MKTTMFFKKDSKRQKGVPFFMAELDREEDGRWIAEIPSLPGVMAYGETKRSALRRVYAIALRTLADTVEEGSTPAPIVVRLFGHELVRR